MSHPVRHAPGAFFLLQPQYLALRNALRLMGREGGIRLIQGVLLVIGIWGSLVWLASRMFTAFLRYPSMTDALMGKALGATWTAALVLAVIAGATAGVGVFFRSKDVKSLLVAPVDWLQRYFAQMAQVLFQGSLPTLLVLSPILVAAGIALDVGVAYVATALFGGFFLLLAAAAWASVLSFLMVSMGGVRHAGKFVALAAVLFMFIALPSLRDFLPLRLVLDSEQVSTVAMLQSLQSQGSLWLPSEWLARAMVRGRGAMDWWGVGALAGVALASVTLSASLFGWGYEWALERSGRTVARGGVRALVSQRERGWEKFLRNAFEPATEQVIRKEMLRLGREVREWGHWGLSFMGASVYLAALAGVPDAGGDALSVLMIRILELLNIGVAGLILASAATHIILPGFYREGVGMWALRSAPQIWGSLVRVKFSISFLVLLPLALWVVVGGWWVLERDLQVFVVTLGGTLATVWALTALGTWVAARFPQYEVRSATAVAASPVAILFILTSLLMVILPLIGSAPLVIPFEQARSAGIQLPYWLDLPALLAWVLWAVSLGLSASLGMFFLGKAEESLRSQSWTPPEPLPEGGESPSH